MLTRAPQSFANSTAEVQGCHIYNTVVRGIITESYNYATREELRWIIWVSINIIITLKEFKPLHVSSEGVRTKQHVAVR